MLPTTKKINKIKNELDAASEYQLIYPFAVCINSKHKFTTTANTSRTTNLSLCCGLTFNQMCPSHTSMFDHLVLSWWCYFGTQNLALTGRWGWR